MSKNFGSYIKHLSEGFRKRPLLYLALAVIVLAVVLFVPGRTTDTTLYSIFLTDPLIAVIILLATLLMTFLINYIVWKYRKR